MYEGLDVSTRIMALLNVQQLSGVSRGLDVLVGVMTSTAFSEKFFFIVC